ncbi:hypothetical protein LINPERPRIM_LOCUS15115 [Linum perenne]
MTTRATFLTGRTLVKGASTSSTWSCSSTFPQGRGKRSATVVIVGGYGRCYVAAANRLEIHPTNWKSTRCSLTEMVEVTAEAARENDDSSTSFAAGFDCSGRRESVEVKWWERRLVESP